MRTILFGRGLVSLVDYLIVKLDNPTNEAYQLIDKDKKEKIRERKPISTLYSIIYTLKITQKTNSSQK